jgi:Bacterial Ig-like domain
MKIFLIRLVVLLIASSSMAFAQGPKLLATSPQSWAVSVNSSSQKTISVTFDQRMSPGYTAWLGKSSIPPLSLNMNSSISDDRHSFTIKADLQPGKVYVLGLNEKNMQGVGFQNEKGLSAPPCFLVFQTAGNVAPQDAPPHVIRSVPQHGATGLDSATLRSLSITFDKPMNVKKHGLHMFENNNPVDISKAPVAYTPDGLTFTLAYAFKPATQYRFELNDIHDIGFSRTTRVPLWPVQISFATAQ